MGKRLRGGILKKGQLQIQETIIVIFVFTVIFVIGLMFFYRYTVNSIEQDIERHKEANFRQLIGYIPSMPELKCSRFYVEEECIDVAKMNAFKFISGDYDFGEIKLNVKEVYLTGNEWQIYDGSPMDYENVLVISSPISLYYPDTGKYGVGVLEISKYD